MDNIETKEKLDTKSLPHQELLQNRKTELQIMQEKVRNAAATQKQSKKNTKATTTHANPDQGTHVLK